MPTYALLSSVRAPRLAASLVVAAVSLGLGWFASARADVIVVNGRLAAHAAVVKTVAVTPAADPGVGPGAAAGGGCEAGPCRPTAAEEAGGDAETMTVSLEDLDTVPEGWLCVPLGGGVELCAPEEDADTLSAFGPLPGQPDPTEGPSSERQVAPGCAGGGAPPWSGGLGLAFVLLLAVWRRR